MYIKQILGSCRPGANQLIPYGLFANSNLVHDKLILTGFDDIVVIAKFFGIGNDFIRILWNTGIGKYFLKAIDRIAGLDTAVFVKDTFLFQR